MTSTDLPAAEAIRRLRAILDGLAEACGGSFTIAESNEGGWWVVSVTPVRREALGFSWTYRGDVIFELDTHGVRWELQATDGELDFVGAVVQSLAAGRVHAVFAPGRAEVTVTLPDGTRKTQHNGQAPVGCLPLPFWPRWGRRRDYRPYR